MSAARPSLPQPAGPPSPEQPTGPPTEPPTGPSTGPPPVPLPLPLPVPLPVPVPPVPPVPLPGLPGSAAEAGTGPASPALLEGLLDDAALLTIDPAAGWAGEAADDDTARAVAGALQRHRDLLAEPLTELLTGPLLVPARLAEAVAQALEPTDHALRLVLVPSPPAPPSPLSSAAPLSSTATSDVAYVTGQLQALRAARSLFLDDDRAELVGVQVPLPVTVPVAPAVRAVVDALDFTVPAWLPLGAQPGWQEALAILAEDGAEGVAAAVAGPHALPAAELACLLRAAVDRELTVRAVGGPLPWVRPEPSAGLSAELSAEGSAELSAELSAAGRAEPSAAGRARRRPEPHGVLNLVCAVRAALNGAEAPDLAGILTADRPAVLLSAVRRMSDADAAVVRAFLAAVPMTPVAGAVRELAALGLLPVDAG